MQDKLKHAFLKGVESMNLEAMSAINVNSNQFANAQNGNHTANGFG
jgi:hypothetical protein